MTNRGRIKTGAGIYHDHYFGKWPNCCPPKSEYEYEEYQHQAKNPDMVFEVEWRGSHWECKEEGYGKAGKYGNGSIFVRDRDGVEEIIKGGVNDD